MATETYPISMKTGDGETIIIYVSSAEDAITPPVGLFDNITSVSNKVVKHRIVNSKKTLRPFGKTDTSTGVLNWTGHITLLSPVPFYGVRFNFVNGDTTVAVSNAVAAYALPDSNPTPCVTTAPWVNITANGVTNINIPAPINGGQPAITQSDLMPVKCVKRTDGDGYLIMIRVYFTATGNTVGLRTSGTTDLATDSLDRLGFQCGYYNGGNAVATPASFVRNSASLGCPVFVELFTSDNVTPTLLVAGDSIVCGQGGGDASTPTAHQNGTYKQYAKYRGWIPMCGAISGSKSPDFIQQAIDKYIEPVKPIYAICPPWSINDDDALVAGVEARILCNMARWMEKCDSNFTVPVFLTPAPKNGITQAQETVRRSVVQTVKNFCTTNNVLMIDRDSIWTDYTSATGGYKAGIYTDDLHPNAAGYTLELALWKTVLG